jgi:hypothetical protein
MRSTLAAVVWNAQISTRISTTYRASVVATQQVFNCCRATKYFCRNCSLGLARSVLPPPVEEACASSIGSQLIRVIGPSQRSQDAGAACPLIQPARYLCASQDVPLVLRDRGRVSATDESWRALGISVSELQLERELARARPADRVEHVLAA